MSPLDAKHPPAARAAAREAEGLARRGLAAPPVLKKGEDGEGSLQVHVDGVTPEPEVPEPLAVCNPMPLYIYK